MIAVLLGLIFLLVLLLGAIHILRVFSVLLLATIREIKCEYEGVRKLAHEIWAEFRTPKDDGEAG